MAGFVAIVEGMAKASRALEIPVVSGNVSFYNQTVGGAVMPTPVIGMVGYVPDVRRALRHRFPRAGLSILAVAIGDWRLDGSGLLWDVLRERDGVVSAIDFDALVSLKDFVLTAIFDGLVASAHDIDSGSLALALAECSYGGVGAQIELPAELVQAAGGLSEALFGFPPVGLTLTVPPEKERDIAALADEYGLPVYDLGETGGETLSVSVAGESKPAISFPALALAALHSESLPYWLST